MKLIRLFLLALLLVPTLFVMGSMASQTSSLGPIQIGACYLEFDGIAEQGTNLKSLTEELTIKEMGLLREVVKMLRAKGIFKINVGTLGRIRESAATSI